MKQTLEEAAREGAEGYNIVGQTIYKFGFRAGAEWHAKQSPWINVEERLPETNDGQSLYEVIVVTSDRRFLVVINTEVEHLVGLLGVTHWMPIPSFDEILETNRDVLERIKEKGD
ncbi:DUF551 domain-containing protein [Bacteroides xylanisolvens]|uniref:DUF551 domain-containing protein n=1 Tax=Bacteroides xylanisolvens TaxID=371601 RepID=UPI0032C0B75F